MHTRETNDNFRILNNLPPRPDPFIDREHEISRIVDALLLDKVSTIALVGLAGIGKTWLALEIAYLLLERGEFKGGMIWLTSHNVQSSDDLLGTIGTVLGVPVPEVYSRLNSQRHLVILDGLDEVSGHQLPEVTRFLETLPTPSQSLVTSRETPRLSSRPYVLGITHFDAEAAEKLFLTLAERHGIEMSGQHPLKIKEIVRALDYHPLALTLAASLVQGLSLNELSLRIWESAANLAEQDGHPEEAIRYWSEILETSQWQPDDHEGDNVQAKAEYHLGRLLVEQGRWYDSLRLLEKSLAICREGDDLGARADTIYQIARTHHLIGNLEKARIHYRDALRLYEHTNNQRGVAACRTGLGRLAIQMGFPSEALRELEQANHTYAALGEFQRTAKVREMQRLADRLREKGKVAA